MEIFKTIIDISSTIAVTIATIFMAFFTRKYVLLTKAMLDEMQIIKEPSISLDIYIDIGGMLYLIISNIGNSYAKKIKIELENKITWRIDATDKINIFKNSISYISPHKKLKYYLGIPNWDMLKEDNCFLRFNLRYQNSINKEFNNIIEIDLKQFIGVSFDSFHEPIEKVTDAIKNINKSNSNMKIANMNINKGLKPKPIKVCPFCGEQIPIIAKKCSHCLEFIENK